VVDLAVRSRVQPGHMASCEKALAFYCVSKSDVWGSAHVRECEAVRAHSAWKGFALGPMMGAVGAFVGAFGIYLAVTHSASSAVLVGAAGALGALAGGSVRWVWRRRSLSGAHIPAVRLDRSEDGR
jgi:hypothetical protein